MSLPAVPRAPRVVVVDDERSIREMLRLRLESMGAQVTAVGEGAKVVEVVTAEMPDLILLDIMMPDMDGFAVIQALKNHEALCEIPVIFMTARDEMDTRIQGLDLGAQDYVVKPFNAAELTARVRAALRVKTLQDELRDKNKILEELATSDPLTGLPNRRTFEEQIYSEVERARRANFPVSLLIFDLDGFKHVNDRYGHQAGDEVLRRVGQVLLNRRRVTDLVARYGGEEFVWLLPGANREAATQVGEWLVRALQAETIKVAAGDVRVSVSVGVSTYVPQEHGDVPTGLLLQHADQALLDAKAQGKARVVFRELSGGPESTAVEQDDAPTDPSAEEAMVQTWRSF